MKKITTLLALFVAPILSNAQINLSNGLQMYLPFNGNANDASGNGNHGVVNGAVLAQDRFGTANSAYYFDGIDDFITVANHASLNPIPDSGFSVCALVKMQGFYNGFCYNNTILSKGNDLSTSPSQYYSLLTTQTITANCNFQDTANHNYRFDYNGNGHANGSQINAIANSAPHVLLEQWDCLVGIFKNDTAYMYVNGILRYKLATVFKPQNSYDLSIGYNNGSTIYPYWFKGVIDEIRIYGRAINEEEIHTYCSMESTSVNAPSLKNTYSIFPNPAKGELFISSNSSGNIGKYQICDMQGRCLKYGNLNMQSNTKVDLAGITNGIYYIRIESSNENIFTQKIIVSN